MKLANLEQVNKFVERFKKSVSENQQNRKSPDEHSKEQELMSASNNSSAQLLSTGSTSQPTNIFRKRNISNSKENRPSQEIYELLDLQSKEELQTNIEISPK
jgi:hypothetical protein